VNLHRGGEATRIPGAADQAAMHKEPDALPEEHTRPAPIPPPDRDLQERVARAREAAAQPKRRNLLVAFFSSRRLLALVVISALVYAGYAIPHLFWVRSPELPLKLAVVDKTVPFKDRREHRALYWLFIQNKFVDPDKSGEARWYDYKTDYIGYYPGLGPGQGSSAALIAPEALADRDLLYISDTYGVYAADYTQFSGDIASTIHSPEIFGGMSADETTAVEDFAKRGKTIIAEFNTCASPTELSVRRRLEAVLGVTWTGWVGRYFVDFRDKEDVPDWLYQMYEKKYNKKWDVTGSGYMLCRDEAQEFIILLDGRDVYPGGLEFVPQRTYTDSDVMQGVKPCTFTYWFDVVLPAKDTEVLAQYQFSLTDSGRAKLAERGLEPIFAAICRQQNDHVSYYIAGEMVDFNRSMGPPDTRLALYVNRSFFSHAQASNESFFFWHTSYPLMSNILRSECRRITGQPEKAFLWK
jgi:hypothetical protein